MNKYYLVALYERLWKCRRFNLRLRYSNNSDKTDRIINGFEILNKPITYNTETATVKWVSTQPINNY